MYLRCAERFVAYHRRSPRELGELEVRAFLDYHVQEKRVSRSTHRVYVAAINFLYSAVAQEAVYGAPRGLTAATKSAPPQP